MKENVFITKVDGNKTETFLSLLKKINMPICLKNICIKPNLNYYRKRDTAATCDPLLLDGLLSALTNLYPNASISLIESDATGTNVDNLFEYLGIDCIADKYGCKMVNVSRESWETVKINGLYFKEMDVPSILSKSDFFISFPKLKSHLKTKITCGLKNQMGLFRPKLKIKYHHVLDELIVDCNMAMKPNISLVDADLVMEGNYGPSYGTPRKLGLLVASRDVVAADSFCAELFGFNPKHIGHIRKASEKGLGNIDFKKMPDFKFNKRQYKLHYNSLLGYAIRIMADRMKK